MAIDWGDVRIGVAACDRDAALAYPLGTVRAGEADIAELAALAAEHEAMELIVGLPRSLSGAEGPAARKVRQWAARLAAAVTPVPVRLLDERLTTVSAAGRLRDSGKPARRQRKSIDAAAAVVILEVALGYERARQQPPGELVSAGPG
ncbi:MAG TPA: Holliday junction resolvase RuvX [Propionibacteriaceae bacterium]|nr:Holliday junction resolvase RuvX [Propionibacteriaceae bacterium]